MRADENCIYIKGSTPVSNICTSVDDVCVLASDITTTTTCTDEQKTFSLTPLGMVAIPGTNWNASTYPGSGSNQVRLTADGLNDDTNFGPTAPVVAFYTPS